MAHVPSIAAVGIVALMSGCDPAPPVPANAASGETRYLNPRGLSAPTGYTHVVVAPDGRTVYIAGQVAMDSAGALVGVGDFRAQTEQVFANLGVALAAVGAGFGDVVKTTTYVTDLSQLALLREIRGRFYDSARLPASTLVQVAKLARPEWLIEIEAVAVLKEPVK